MKNILLFVAILLWSTCCVADSFIRFTVLPSDGAKLMSRPSDEAKPLTIIPCGTTFESGIVKVDYRGTENNGDDTMVYHIQHKTVTVNGMRGFWVACSYNKLSGYVFSAQLIPVNESKYVEKEVHNSAMILLCTPPTWYESIQPKPAANSYKTNVFLPHYHWYSLTEDSAKQHTTMKAQTPHVQYYVVEESLVIEPTGPEDIYTTWVAYYTFSEDKPFDALLMAKNALPELSNTSKPNFKKLLNSDSVSQLSFTNVTYKGHNYAFSFNERKEEKWPFQEKDWHVTIDKGPRFSLDQEGWVTTSVKWAGDVNNDGYLDFIMAYYAGADAGQEITTKMKLMYSNTSTGALSYDTTDFFW